MSKLLYLSDLDAAGSGYCNLSLPLCEELSKLGHEIKCIGLGYRGQEHNYHFGIIPAIGFPDVNAIITNLVNMWKFDVFICALDIPHQERLTHTMQNRPFKYIGIMPIEAEPLCMSWAMALLMMDKAFIISEYGTNAAIKAGVYHAEHLRLGIDCEAWKIPAPEQKLKIRKSLGIADDEFIVLTVADNQERKNPHRLLETYAEFAKDKKARYIFITREANPAGGRLRDYAAELGMNQQLMLIERGISHEQLWAFYAASDVFLLASKSEGLGLPILEAFACGVPVIATNCTAICELLAGNRGLLVDYDYQHRDCFGNGWRYWFDRKHGVSMLNKVYEEGFDTKPAREYIESRTWDVPAKALNDAIAKVLETK